MKKIFSFFKPDGGSLFERIFVALAIRDAIENLRIAHKKTLLQKKFLTVSIGAATIRPTNEKSSLELLALADQVLYAAKNNGRDRIETDFVGA
ncbi:MAG: diguanylate cyclase [Candidatus Aminicenantes bacterium]|nr:diguanylate cyclase [Candidatus Aminicenantes bacterium]